LATAISQIIKSAYEDAGIWGTLIAPIIIGAMFSLWSSAKTDAINQSMPKMGEGGWIDGKPHSRGGVMINAEGGEYVTNKKSAAKYAPILDAINEDRFNITLDHKLVKDLDAQQHYLDMMQASISLDESKTYKEIREMNKYFKSLGNKSVDYGNGFRVEKTKNKIRKIRDN